MKIFIANFPFDLTEEDICDLFKIFGEITNCILIRDADSKKSKGFGFVEFKEEAAARMAMRKMNGVSISGRNVAVTRSKSEKTFPAHKKTA